MTIAYESSGFPGYDYKGLESSRSLYDLIKLCVSEMNVIVSTTDYRDIDYDDISFYTDIICRANKMTCMRGNDTSHSAIMFAIYDE